MNADKTKPQARLPLSYIISRCEELVRVRAGNRDELRLIRTELELLRRIHRHTLNQRTPRGVMRTRPNPNKYTPADRRELIEILADSSDAIVEKMITVLDAEFADIRKGIMMSVVNDEAEKIAHEAVESGAIEMVGPGTDSEPPTSIPPDVEAALQLAESKLAACKGEPNQPDDVSLAADDAAPAAAETPDPSPVDSADVTPSDTPKEPAVCEAEPADCATEPIDTTPQSKQNDEPTEKDTPKAQSTETAPASSDDSSKPAPDATPEAVDEPSVEDTSKTDEPVASETEEEKPEGKATEPQTDAVVDAPQDNSTQQEEAAEQPPAAPSPEPESLPEASESSSAIEPAEEKAEPKSADEEFTADRAEKAVAAIEDGIRKLAHLLRTEVKGQWDQAKAAMKNVSGANDQVDGVCQQVREALAKAEHATRDIHAARDEAKLFRQEALQAKERAETSAAAAELAANQVADELRMIQKMRLRDTEAAPKPVASA